MFDKLKKYSVPSNYYYKYKLYRTRIKTFLLSHKVFKPVPIKLLWSPNDCCFPNISNYDLNSFYTFCRKIEFNKIDWHLDLSSGYRFPLIRYDCFKIHNYFNKGIDIKFPWEVGRFNFAINLSQNYLGSKESIYYKLFRESVLNFIHSNPFLYGIHWVSAMEVGIRSINWIISLNLFKDLYKNDHEFHSAISISLLKHAEYLYSFPEVYFRNHTTNHTVSNYAGLLFIATSVNSYSKSKIWKYEAIKQLERCIRYQVYDDGGNFEGSINYHRLVTELFAYIAIFALSNNINLTNDYYKILFKMFEFTASCLDQRGNAPQIGDNDSGRLIKFLEPEQNPSYFDNHNHSFLICLGEHIFDYKFQSQCSDRNDNIIKYLPFIKKIDVSQLNLSLRSTAKSIRLDKSGVYTLNKNNFSVVVSCIPLGQNGRGGHNHLDTGSFTLSANREQLIVDPGTYTYTRNKRERDHFRSYISHNTIYTEKDTEINLSDNSYWDLKEFYYSDIINFEDNRLNISMRYRDDPNTRFREFVIDSDSFNIYDQYNGHFYSRINFHPFIKIISCHPNKIITNKFIVLAQYHSSYNIIDFDYSPHYDNRIKSKAVIFSASNNLHLKYVIIT